MDRRFLSLGLAALAVLGIVVGSIDVQGALAAPAGAHHPAKVVKVLSDGRHVPSANLLPNLLPSVSLVAVSLPVCRPAAMSGYLAPGVRIAVYDTRRNRPRRFACPVRQASGDGSAKALIASAAEVISVQGTPVAKSGVCSANCKGETLVTVAVLPTEARKLVNAATNGDLTLTLLSAATPSSALTSYSSAP